GCLSECVWDERKLRPPPLMVDLTVVNGDDGSVGWRKDRAPERVEPLGRFRRERGAPVADARSATAVIHGHEVDGVALAEHIDSVARHPPRRTVLCLPDSGEREGDEGGVGSDQAPWNFVSIVFCAPV